MTSSLIKSKNIIVPVHIYKELNRNTQLFYTFVQGVSQGAKMMMKQW